MPPAHTVERRGTYKVSVGKPEEKRPFGRSRHRLGDIIKMDLQEIGQGGIDRIDLNQDRDKRLAFVNTLITFRFHKMRGI
jgi:hypothetical protein